MKSLKKLVDKLPLEHICGPKDVPITGLTAHSKSVAPGNIFLATSPITERSLTFIDEAITAGASVIICNQKVPIVEGHITQLYTDKMDEVEIALANRVYPRDEMLLCGITGTNGKTTVSYLIKHMLTALGKKVGVIGTIGYWIGEMQLEASLTTPDTITIARLLSEMSKQGCEVVVMEASSHGLIQGRTKGLTFNHAIFTNLTQDHLDYHGSMEAYAQAKRILFKELSPDAVAIYNEQSPYSEVLLEGCEAKKVSYGFSPDADLSATGLELFPSHTHFQVRQSENALAMHSPLVGDYNVLNVLAAMSYCHQLGYSLEQLKATLPSFEGVPGRLDPVDNPFGVNLFVDFAHTPDALANVCATLKRSTKGQLLVVFGAGGDRDQEKRPLMGGAVDQHADFAFITTDNPRGEDPQVICDAIAGGCQEGCYEIELDRKEAMRLALQKAEKGDTILVTGKGHEAFMIWQHKTVAFDDKKVLQELVEERVCIGK